MSLSEIVDSCHIPLNFTSVFPDFLQRVTKLIRMMTWTNFLSLHCKHQNDPTVTTCPYYSQLSDYLMPLERVRAPAAPPALPSMSWIFIGLLSSCKLLYFLTAEIASSRLSKMTSAASSDRPLQPIRLSGKRLCCLLPVRPQASISVYFLLPYSALRRVENQILSSVSPFSISHE